MSEASQLENGNDLWPEERAEFNQRLKDDAGSTWWPDANVDLLRATPETLALLAGEFGVGQALILPGLPTRDEYFGLTGEETAARIDRYCAEIRTQYPDVQPVTVSPLEPRPFLADRTGDGNDLHPAEGQ